MWPPDFRLIVLPTLPPLETSPKSTMPAFTSHIFICGNQREPQHPRGCCDPDGSEVLRNAFKTEVAKRKLGPLVRANKAGCLEQCEMGPTVVIYPQGIWYGRVQLSDVARILDETVIAGRILEDLLIPTACLNNSKCADRQLETCAAACTACDRPAIA